MALKAVGTKLTTSLSGIQFVRGMNETDLASLVVHILNDGSQLGGGAVANAAPSAKPVWPEAFNTQGVLYVPNRGYLQALPGDYVCYDANGWPILLSANAIAGGSSPSATTDWDVT
jgi:hypothetical protein